MKSKKKRKYGKSEFAKLMKCFIKYGWSINGLNHNYHEISHKYNKQSEMFEQVLECTMCGAKSVGYSKHPLSKFNQKKDI